MSTSFTQEQLAAMEAAIATAGSGPLRVEYEGRSVTYRSLDDLIKAANYVRGQLTTSSATARRSTLAGYRSGYCS